MSYFYWSLHVLRIPLLNFIKVFGLCESYFVVVVLGPYNVILSKIRGKTVLGWGEGVLIEDRNEDYNI